jgi:hypothetical protein
MKSVKSAFGMMTVKMNTMPKLSGVDRIITSASAKRSPISKRMERANNAVGRMFDRPGPTSCSVSDVSDRRLAASARLYSSDDDPAGRNLERGFDNVVPAGEIVLRFSVVNFDRDGNAHVSHGADPDHSRRNRKQARYRLVSPTRRQVAHGDFVLNVELVVVGENREFE